jgi:hypothetical protein
MWMASIFLTTMCPTPQSHIYHGPEIPSAPRRVSRSSEGCRGRRVDWSRSCLVLSAGLDSDKTDAPERLTPTSAEDLANALAFALRSEGRTRVHNADEIMSAIVAKCLVEHLERSGFVVMKKPPIGGAAALGRGHEAR